MTKKCDIRIGKVTAVRPEKGTVQVTFEDKNEIPLELPLLSVEYNLPRVNETVWCVFHDIGDDGICLGRAYSKNNPPPRQDEEIYFKPLRKNAFIEYNENTQTMTIKVKHLIFDCDDAISTGELGDKVRYISGDRTIYNGHSNPNNGASPPNPQM